jgi:hypothetical protein
VYDNGIGEGMICLKDQDPDFIFETEEVHIGTIGF